MQGPFTMRQRLEAARADGRIMLGGHRGNPAEYPENTLVSFRSAIAAGCDLVECDVHLTADGELAVIHDHLLERTTNGTGLVGVHTLAELRELDAGKGEKIPLLEELFDLCRDRVGLVIETKQNPIPYPGLEERLAAAIREHEMTEQVRVISFHHGCIRPLKEVAPERDLGDLRQLRMTAGKHQAQLVAANRRRAEGLGYGWRERPFAFQPEPEPELRRVGAGGAFAAQNVERAMLRRGHQPRGWILRHAVQLPHLDCPYERVLHHILGEREIVDAEQSRERGDHPSRFPTEEMVAWLRHYMLIWMTGRTSTKPPASKIGQPDASLAASSMSVVCTIE